MHSPPVTIARLAALIVFGAGVALPSAAQDVAKLSDSLRAANGIPEIGYAVVSAQEVLALHVDGVRQAGTSRAATIDDRFRIGSVTKTVTSLIAARLVRSRMIRWDTKLFDLVPELRAGSHAAYARLTLRDLLSFRARLIPWTYTDPSPVPGDFAGDAGAQRTAFLRWALRQPPVPRGDGVHFSNVAYVAAGAMLERASGRPYTDLVRELGDSLHITFHFGAPNTRDSSATWGHAADGTPDAPHDDLRLEWLQAAGNLTLTLPDLATLMQYQLRGLAGQASMLGQRAFGAMHTGRPTWALGWKWFTDDSGEIRSFHVGNPGTFLSMVYVHHHAGLAYILVANRQSDGAMHSLEMLYQALSALHRSPAQH